jgi:hypothetical protein
MAQDPYLQVLHKAHSDSQDKYTYFLLAAAGAAIGFAVQKTEGLMLSWWLLPVAAATLLWAISFYFGCKNVDWVQRAMSANFTLLQLKQGTHPDQPPHPQLFEAAVSGVTSALQGNVERASFYARWQFFTLIAGAVCFISWRVAEMVRIT